MARYERRFAKHEVESWKFIHGNFLPYQTLSDLGAPETIRNHFRLLLKFMRRLDFFRLKFFTNTCEGKIDVGKVFLVFLDEWMAAARQMDPSSFELHNLKLLWCTLWITNTSRRDPWGDLSEKCWQVRVDCCCNDVEISWNRRGNFRVFFSPRQTAK